MASRLITTAGIYGTTSPGLQLLLYVRIYKERLYMGQTLIANASKSIPVRVRAHFP